MGIIYLTVGKLGTNVTSASEHLLFFFGRDTKKRREIHPFGRDTKTTTREVHDEVTLLLSLLVLGLGDLEDSAAGELELLGGHRGEPGDGVLHEVVLVASFL